MLLVVFSKVKKVLKPFLVEMFDERISDIIVEIENSKSFISEKKPSAIVVLSENGITEQILLKLDIKTRKNKNEK